MKTKRIVEILLAIGLTAMLLLSACSDAAAGTDKPMPSNSETAATTATAIRTVTPEPTATTEPTATMTPAPTPTAEPTASPAATPIVEAGAPDIIGLYLLRTTRRLVTEYKTKWVKGKDIGVFYAVTTNEPCLKPGSHKATFEHYWKKYPKAYGYKIGYYLTYTLKSSKVISMMIKSAKDAPKDPKMYFYQFIEIYLYDNIHLDPDKKYGTWHLVEKRMKKDTLMTSIKLTAGKKYSEVVSAKLTAFVFKDDSDFDPITGMYIGPASYEISVKRK